MHHGQSAMPPPKSPSGSLRGMQDASMAAAFPGGAPNHILKRSFSTPSVGGATPTSYLESQPLVPQMGDKKRNKLGYHRTSIACGHCRRRKIRCIISSEDQNRCVNCIRLKKECSFHPVDQQQPFDQKLPPSTPTPGGSSAATASSSPAISRGSSVDQGPQRQNYPTIPVASVPSMGTPAIQTPQNEYFSSEMEDPSHAMTPGPSYAVGESSSAGWMAGDADSSAMPKAREQNVMWRPYPAPEVPIHIGGQLSPYADPAAAWPGSGFASGHEMGWNSNMPPPPRSMSFSGEVLGSHHAPQFYAMPQQNQIYERQSQQFTHIYGGVPVGEPDEAIEQAIDPAIMGTTVIPSATPIAWQQQQQQQQPPQPPQPPQLMSQQQQQHQMPDARGGGVYHEWPGYGQGDIAHHM